VFREYDKKTQERDAQTAKAAQHLQDRKLLHRFLQTAQMLVNMRGEARSVYEREDK
jgi:hypothetical protein